MKSGEIKCQNETVDSARGELGPLLANHYEELTWKKDKFTLDPDWERYVQLERLGRMKGYTMRQDGILVGYAAFFVSPHIHYKGVLMASNDVLYVAPEFRGLASLSFISFCEGALKGEGVQCVVMHIKKWMDWGVIARRFGYDEVETNYQKWIGD